MKNQKSVIWISLCLVLLFTLVSAGRAATLHPIVCDSPYALCNAAACQQIPNTKDRALCTCSMWEGKNIGFSSCKQRAKQATLHEQTKLLSTFSFGGMHYKYMTCPSGKPWTTCLDQSCLVDKNDPRRAYCNCKIQEGTPYVTFAGMCEKNACDKSMWSGAKVQDNLHFMKLLQEAMHVDKPLMEQCTK